MEGVKNMRFLDQIKNGGYSMYGECTNMRFHDQIKKEEYKMYEEFINMQFPV